jgi:hypothetical protein
MGVAQTEICSRILDMDNALTPVATFRPAPVAKAKPLTGKWAAIDAMRQAVHHGGLTEQKLTVEAIMAYGVRAHLAATPLQQIADRIAFDLEFGRP